MAWRIHQNVIKGEIHNQVPGEVTGLIWLKGLNKPLELKLQGNCYRDLAGTTLAFQNPHPVEGEYGGLNIRQNGVVGDITASRKVKVPLDREKSISEFPKGKFPYTIQNCLYLEWFSEANGRVLIETTDFTWKVGLPKWTLTEEDEIEQRLKNQQAMFEFMDQLTQAIEPEDEDEPSDQEMDEFQWEAFLQKSEARSDMLMELFEKYGDDPDCENIVAEAMGWDIERVEYPEELDEENDLFEEDDDDDDYVPNHPLISAMMDVTSRIFFEGESRKLFTKDSNNPWNQLLWNSQLAVSKLIASLEEDEDAPPNEPGFVVATLKRALSLVHLAIATLEAASSLQNKKEAWQLETRRDLFAIRESILDLMQAYRGKGP